MDLKNFSKTNQTTSNETNTSKQNSGLREDDVRRAIKHFSGMSNDQLTRELAKQIAMKKQQGKESEIINTLTRIKPLLSSEQAKRMEEIMRSLNVGPSN